jgi:tetratricopeptide (TPR) repeat protein
MVRIITMIVIGFLFVNSVNAQTNEKYFEHNLKQGDTLVFFSKFDKAIDLYESLLQNPSTGAMGKVMLLNKLSAVHRLYKRYDKALEYAQQAKAKSVLMNSKTQEAEAMDNIGAIHVSRRVHLDKAMVLHEKALKLKLKHSPRDSLSIAYSHFYIGKVLHFQRLSNKAIDAYQQSLSLLMESTLDATRLKLNLWYSLGASYAYLGDNDACFKWLNKALKTSKKLMPEEGTLHISIYSALASYYRYQYEPNKAIQYYNNALNLSIKYFGFNHDDQAKIHINIGNAYNEANELDKAIYHLQKGNEMMAKIYGEKHKYLFNIYVILGNAYYDNEGLQYLKKALDLCLDTVGENHWKTALVYRCMSNIYFELKQYQRAVEFGTKCLEIDQRIYGETHIVMVDHYNSIS